MLKIFSFSNIVCGGAALIVRSGDLLRITTRLTALWALPFASHPWQPYPKDRSILMYQHFFRRRTCIKQTNLLIQTAFVVHPHFSRRFLMHCTAQARDSSATCEQGLGV